MKHIKFLFLALTASVLAFSSCKKADQIVAQVTPNISMTFNGTAFSSATPIATYNKTGNAIGIAGGFSSTSAISLVIDSVKVGTYNLATSNNALAIYTTGASLSDNYIATSGTIVVTAFTSTSITGTFQFAATDLANVSGTVTSGSFNAYYTTQN